MQLIRRISSLEPSYYRMSSALVLSFQLLTSFSTTWVRSEADHKVVISEEKANNDRVLWVEPGSPLHLKCLSHSGSLLQWYHEGHLLTPANQVTITTSLDIVTGRQTSLLSRNSVGSHETGNYECWDIRSSRLEGFVAVHLSTVPMRERVRVQIVEPSSKSVVVRVGSVLALRCTGSAGSKLLWFRDGDAGQLQTNDVLVIQTALDPQRPDTMTSLLQVTSVTARHAGTYSCRNQRDPSDRDDVTVSVDDSRSAGTFDYLGDDGGDVVVMEANLVTLRMTSELSLGCSFEAAGGGIVQQWSKDGQQLTATTSSNSPMSKYVISRNSTTLTSSLRIRNTDRSDAGVYRCTFQRTDSGNAIAAVQFSVTTLPCPPVDPPINGRLDMCPQPPVFGDTCSFTCRPGYRLTDPRPVQCERRPEGQTYWTRPTPACIATLLPVADLSGSSLDGVISDLPSTVSHVLLRVGENLVLECSGKTTWSRRGVVLENSAKYTVDQVSLTIRNADRSDVGIYDCTIVKETVAGNFRFNVTTLPCPRFPAFYGTVDWCPVNSSVYGDTCVFRCPPGSSLIGSQLRSCELLGTSSQPYWTGQPASCTGSAASLVAMANSANIPLLAVTSSSAFSLLIHLMTSAAVSLLTHQ